MPTTWRDRAQGHYWTLRPVAAAMVRPPEPPPGRIWLGMAPPLGTNRLPVRVSGGLHAVPGARTLAVIIHGLGGHADSPYMMPMARACVRAGFAALRLSMRGADGRGLDFYHAGLTSDLAAVLAHPEFASYERVVLVGFSLGGNITIKAAAEGVDTRVAAAVGISPPLDLAAGQRAIDSAAWVGYRQYILASLKAMYVRIARRRAMPSPLWRALAAGTIWEWDRWTVVPRHGFRDPADYYAQASAANYVHGLRVPVLVVSGLHDPMTPPEVVRPGIARAGGAIEMRWLEAGGHVGFPARTDLGMGGELGVPGQIAAWLGKWREGSLAAPPQAQN